MQQEFESLERSACTFKSIHEDYKNLYHLNYALQPHERCMHGGAEPSIDEKISFRGKPLEKCDSKKQPEGTYADMYAIEKLDSKTNVFHTSTKARVNTRESARLRDFVAR